MIPMDGVSSSCRCAGPCLRSGALSSGIGVPGGRLQSSTLLRPPVNRLSAPPGAHQGADGSGPYLLRHHLSGRVRRACGGLLDGAMRMYSLMACLLMPVTSAVDEAKPFGLPSRLVSETWFPKLSCCSLNDSHKIFRFFRAAAFSIPDCAACLPNTSQPSWENHTTI